MTAVNPDPGLRGVVPFVFDCLRSGNCCTHGEGHVWLAPGEVERLAAARGMAVAAFRARHVTLAPDPRDGTTREALRESADAPAGNGRCSLLEGRHHCSVYDDRPQHCRDYPYWESVTGDAAGFERARAICPGIRPVVPEAVRKEAFTRVEALYAEVDRVVEQSHAVCLARGLCCRFEDAGHELFATALEADFAAAKEPHAPAPAGPGRCPYHVGGRCTARAARPLGCRTYFCDPAQEDALARTHEHFLARLRAIEAETGYPTAYARFPAMVGARGVGRGADRADSAGATP